MSKIHNWVKHPEVKYILSLFLLTRLILIVIAFVASNFQFTTYHRTYDTPDEYSKYGYIGTIFHGWDSEWYMLIADQGYKKGPLNIKMDDHSIAYAFFPMYPLLARSAGTLFGSSVAGGIIISNLSLLVSGFLIYYLAKDLFNTKVGLLSAKFLFLFPSSFIFSAIQSESLFLMLLLAIYLALTRKKFFLASIASFFLALTRQNGFLMFYPIIYEFTKEIIKKNNLTQIYKVFLAGFLPVTGLLIFIIFSYLMTGNIMTVFVVERAWGKYLNFDVKTLYDTLYFSGAIGKLILLSVILSISTFTAGVLGTVRLGFIYKYLVLLFPLTILLTTTRLFHLCSLPRYMSILFPVFFLLANISSNNKKWNFSLTVSCLVLQSVLYFMWVRGIPVMI